MTLLQESQRHTRYPTCVSCIRAHITRTAIKLLKGHLQIIKFSAGGYAANNRQLAPISLYAVKNRPGAPIPGDSCPRGRRRCVCGEIRLFFLVFVVRGCGGYAVIVACVK